LLLFYIAVYDFVLLLYYIAAVLVAPFMPKAKQWLQGRKETQQRLSTFKVSSCKNRIWFHCSSLGEFEQARPLIEMVKREVPDCYIYLSFFSPSGLEPTKNKQVADLIFYLPHDTRSNAQWLLGQLQPTLVFWTKYDFFFHYLSELQAAKVPTVLFAARFLPNQIFFKTYGALHKRMLTFFSYVLVQDSNSKKLLDTIRIESEVVEDTRFDRVKAIAQQSFSNEIIERFLQGNKRVLVAGSTWLDDEKIIAAALQQSSDVKVIVAPHQITESNLLATESLFAAQQAQVAFYSKFCDADASKKVLIIDNIGMLSHLYRYAQVCYVGGGFGAGVHNVLEAAVYGKPVVVGTNFHKSLECIELIRAGAIFSISNAAALAAVMEMLEDSSKLKSVEAIALQFIEKNSGGTQKIFSHAKQFFK